MDGHDLDREEPADEQTGPGPGLEFIQTMVEEDDTFCWQADVASMMDGMPFRQPGVGVPRLVRVERPTADGVVRRNTAGIARQSVGASGMGDGRGV